MTLHRPSQSLEFRAVNPLEEPALSLLKEAFIDARLLYPELHPDPDELPSNHPLKERESYLLGFIGNKPLASGAIRNIDRWTGEVTRIYVHRNHRKRGIGRQLLQELFQTAHNWGYQTLRLETGFKQEAAIELYQSMGFYQIPAFGPYKDDPTSLCFELKAPFLRSTEG